MLAKSSQRKRLSAWNDSPDRQGPLVHAREGIVMGYRPNHAHVAHTRAHAHTLVRDKLERRSRASCLRVFSGDPAFMPDDYLRYRSAESTKQRLMINKSFHFEKRGSRHLAYSSRHPVFRDSENCERRRL